MGRLHLIDKEPGSGPRHLTFHPNGQYAYLVEEMGGQVDVYRYQPGTGRLDPLQRITAHADSVKGPYRGADLHVSADGRFLYVSCREAASTIAIFAIDATSGPAHGPGVSTRIRRRSQRNFALDPAGRFLLVGNR